MLELSCKAFAPPAPRLSLVQEIVREKMRHRFPGAQLGVKSWPSLLQRHEQAAEAAEQWEPPTAPEGEDEAEYMCEDLCDKLKDEGCLREQRAAMSKLMVAKLYRAMIKGIANQTNCITDWFSWFGNDYAVGMVAAGAPHALVKVLHSDMYEAKADAAMTLANITIEGQHVGAVVAAGAIEACATTLQTGPDEAKMNAARTLANISYHEQHVGAVVPGGAVEACIVVLQSGPDDGKYDAARTLATIARYEQHVGAVVAAGAVEACIAVLQTGPDEAKSTTAGILASISCYEQHVHAVAVAGAIKACVAVLQSGSDDAKANVAATLANISNEEHAGAMVAAGAIEACVTLLETGPDDAKAPAAGTLANISYNGQHLENLMAAGVIATALNMMMHSMDSEVKLCATLILAHASEHLDVAVIPDVVTPLVKELQKGADETDEQDELAATRALSRILRHRQHADAVVVGGGVAALTRVRQSGSQSARNEASVALDRISEVMLEACPSSTQIVHRQYK